MSRKSLPILENNQAILLTVTYTLITLEKQQVQTETAKFRL